LSSPPGERAGGDAGAELVSCIVPAHNAAAHLRMALDSILDQTHRPLEIVVVDDGSTDDTAAIAASYGEPVRVVHQVDAGPAATRNLGIRSARAELVAFLDPDDLWHPEKLARQVARFRARPELDCSVTHVRMFWPEGHDDVERRYRDHPRMAGIPGYATGSLLARRSAFDRVGPLNTGLWFTDAVDWFVRAREHGLAIELLDDVLVFHRLHRDNLTSRREEASRDEFLALVKGALDRRRGRSQE
jgi:glycosyltransferase involved in cell wall biosynthesis